MHSDKIIQSLSYKSKSAEGNHAICYEHPTDRHKILLATKCPVREHLSSKDVFKNDHFPKIRRIGTMENNTPVYEMPKYRHITRETRKRMNAFTKRIYVELQCRVTDLQTLKSSKIIPKSMKVAILRNYKDMRAKGLRPLFDICHQNIMIDNNNQLILTDLFWIHKENYL